MKSRGAWAMKFRGDTLIEVSLAIAVFALVAVTIAEVVGASMSSAQSALETTTTREQIDAQAEALRFIHASYIAGGTEYDGNSSSSNTAGENRYVKLWRKITALAKNRGESFNFTPTTCEELYTRSEANGYLSLADQGVFVINSHALYTLNDSYSTDESFDTLAANIVVSAANSPNVFQTAATFPRIVYSGRDAGDENTWIGQGVGTKIGAAEGIYVIPVKDESSTTIVQTTQGRVTNSTTVRKKAAYYDFYIRSCWFQSGADRPSTISTVIRLYDPDVIEY